MSNYQKFLKTILPVTFILPFLEINVVQRLFDIRTDKSYLPGITFLLVPFIFLFFFGTKGKKNPNRNVSKAFVCLCIYGLYLFANSLITICVGNIVTNATTILFQCLYFVIPLLYSLSIVRFIVSEKIDTVRMTKNSVIAFGIYLIICIVVNYKNYGFSILNGSRLISPGGGATILGYTISVVMALIFCMRPFKNRAVEILFSLFFLASAFLTGSRGGIWSAAVLFLLTLFIKNGRICWHYILMFVILLIAINPVSIINTYLPRLLSWESVNRYLTFNNSVGAFGSFNVAEKIFGKGVGNLFPYQEWKLETYATGWAYNMFEFNGFSLLAEPHNTYVYVLLEQGVLGFVLYLTVLFFFLKSCFRNGRLLFGPFIVFVTFVLVGVIETTVFFQPGVAGMWLIILFTSSSTEVRQMNLKEREPLIVSCYAQKN